MRVVLSSRRPCTYTQLPQASVRSRPDTAGIAVVLVLTTLEDATAGARHGPAPTPPGGDALPSIRARRLAERPAPGHPILHALIAPSSRGRDPLSESGCSWRCPARAPVVPRAHPPSMRILAHHLPTTPRRPLSRSLREPPLAGVALVARPRRR